jgi:glycosyltransferase involved in cell wall biosynthesis
MISVITVVFNAQNELKKTIQSVLDQTFSDIEFIIVDGGSKDGTVRLIEFFNNRITKWVSEKDLGIYDAMNKGVRMATRDYVLFMNAGDLFFDTNVLRDLHDFVSVNSQYQIVYGDAEIITSKGSHIQNQKNRHADLTKSIIHQSMLIKRSHLVSNPYNTSLRIMADYDNLLGLSVSHPQAIFYLKRVICIYNKFGVSSKPLYRYFAEYYLIAYNRMPFWNWIRFNLYIFPRLFYSFRFLLISK